MLTQLEQFRNEVYNWFPHRADALMDLLDALSSTTTARSVVELSLHPLFRRSYSSVHDGIENLFVASGHYRNGILLAPITAEIMADLILERDAGAFGRAFAPPRAVATQV